MQNMIAEEKKWKQDTDIVLLAHESDLEALVEQDAVV
jgi:hypothetical protein